MKVMGFSQACCNKQQPQQIVLASSIKDRFHHVMPYGSKNVLQGSYGGPKRGMKSIYLGVHHGERR